MTKKVLILGATGRIGRILTATLMKNQHVRQTAYVRDAEKLKTLGFPDINAIQGDVLDTEALTAAMQGQDTVAAILSGDLLKQANSIVRALQQSGVKRIIWITGMGIHHEVPGEVGKMLDRLVMQFPEYVQAADVIAGSETAYTLVRAAHLTDGHNENYHIQKEGEAIHSESIDRCAVAKFIADMITDNNGLGENDSLGITN
jgi:uncharacterized protein YbjT (DUF2867 family)